MVETQRPAGSPTLSATFVQILPPSRVTQRLPSSVPTQSVSGLRGDSASAVALPRLVRVISGEMIRRSSPRLTDRQTYSPPTYSMLGLWLDRMNGVFQLKRCCEAPLACPFGRTVLNSPVFRLRLKMKPPWL